MIPTYRGYCMITQLSRRLVIMSKLANFHVKEQICAPFTPMKDDGEINHSFVKTYADYLVQTHFTGVFINGSMAEGSSLTLDERKRMAETWIESSDGRLEVIVHVGTNCIKDSQELAKHAEKIGATAIAAFSPSYYKPENEEVLVDVMAEIAGEAPNTPFYFYEINFMTGVHINTRKFCELAMKKIPSFRGLKHSKREMPSLHDCSMVENLQVLVGTDFQYLSSLVLGVKGIVTASYLGNITYDMRTAFEAGDIEKTRDIQKISHRINNIRFKYGGSARTCKAMFNILSGMDVGPVRLPLRKLTTEEFENMKKDFTDAGLAGIAKLK
ncbi:N-acetylneuraminate lyase-like isoform X1 [Mercenaria mercenaria]|uniref:N-acetylneuraminate lyase-like isoform X1 n=1 Tax=Mercenaria mercenaria TaxID=6596 RepID=UPI00234FAA9A|nr:N-acetylneuraminate lyase-like isoform X1 [Mercenaria mercenaria]